MKRWLNICVFLLCQLVLFAQAGASGNDYNPNTPPNPEQPRPKFELRVKVSPAMAGTVNSDSLSKIMVGTKVFLETWNRGDGFVFDYWAENGEPVSTKEYFYYDMPERNVTLTAVYRYDPATPANPETPRLKHTLYLESQPVRAGNFNWNSISQMREGDETWIYAYNYNGFKFKEWQYEGQTVSTENGFMFTMPQKDAHLLAIYEYAPSLPMNPGSNHFNPETGEVIVNDYTAGGLSYALEQLVGWDNRNAVTMITLAGRNTNGDWGYIREYPNTTVIDMSRTGGMTAVPSWCFEYCQNLQSVLLPASVGRIEQYAFYACYQLQTVTVLAATPPTLARYAFTDCDTENMIVYVPAACVPLYQAAEGWKDLNIQALASEVNALEVNLPENAGTTYKGMYVELYNLKSGLRHRYVITDRLSYTFNSLINHTSYNVYLKDGNDRVLGEIDNVIIETDDVSVTFTDLLVPRTVSLKVETPAGEDVTNQVTATWMDAQGTYLARGSQLAAQLDGTVLKYRIALPQMLAMQYQLPADQEFTVSEETEQYYQLAAIPAITISGDVEDVQDHDPIARATISVSQVLNGQFTKSYTTRTDREGKWTLDVQQAPTEVTASMSSYVSQTKSFEEVPAVIPTFQLKDINGSRISLNLTYTDVNGQTTVGYADKNNVTYTVYNETKQQAITDFNVQYPTMVLMESNVGDVLRITATSKTQKFLPVESTCTVDNNDVASITLPIKQLGGIKASFITTDNPSIVGILYDGNGKLVAKYDYADNALTVNELVDGQYTLVTMAGSQFFNSIFSLDQFANSGLREGIDYVKNTVTVESAKWAYINNQIVPYLNETKLYYTSAKTSFTVNKSQITAGQYLTMSAYVEFKSNYAAGVSNVKLIVALPESAEFVDNSVLIGTAATGYTYNDAEHMVTIPLSVLSDRIRFCVIPTAGGTYSPATAVQFQFDGKTFTQPIGSVTYTVKDLSINVPSVVSNKNVPVSGTALGKATIKVYGDSILLGQTTALANGSWATNVDLVIDDETAKSSHLIYAIITKDNLEMQSETQTVEYDPDAIQVKNVIMYYTNPEENWWRGKNYEMVHDFLSPSVIPFRYVYYIFNRSFSFTINFTTNDPEKITDVVLEVKTGDGRWNKVTTKYDGRKQCWLAYGEFGNMYDGIVPVNVRVCFTFGGKTFIVPYPGPDADVPIDPSGYVYEAVPSNRVQGVTATIYYKETVEDMHGDKHDNIVVWDAEEYAQENPLFTDENGMYRWDVPQGLWQVKFEKEGYQTAYSEWLPVPPPQLDVNIAITRLAQPSVKTAGAFDKGVDIEFDMFMDPATLSAENITVMKNGEIVLGTFELLNAENISENDSQQYASKVRFNAPEDEDFLFTDNIHLVVNSAVKSYAGLPMTGSYEQDFNVAPKMKEIVVDETVNLEYGNERTLTVAALPAEASKGKKMIVNALSPAIASVDVTEVTLNENGEAEVKVTGQMPGATVLTFTMEDVDLTNHTTVTVKEAALLQTIAPRASRVSGSKLYRNTKINLSSETENAEIKYTLDGTDPSESPSAIIYSDDAPIVVTSDELTVKAVAKGHDLTASEVKSFDYTLKKTAIGMNLPAGWLWISHNLEEPIAPNELDVDIERLTSQTQEVIKDPKAGLIGNLKELNPGEAYKLKTAVAGLTTVSGYEFDATSLTVPVTAGWNWLGYPVGQAMTVSEALAFYAANEGDIIVGQNGSAEFAEGEWHGNLEGLTPGKGYMFKAAAANDILFNNTIVSVAGSRMGQRNYLISSPWAPAKYGYPNVMPLTAELYVNGERVNDGEFVVGAFADSECRGVGQWKNGRLLMTVYGDRGENIRFVAKHLTDDIYYDITEQVAFAADNVGSWRAPYALSVGNESTAVEEISSELSVTPAVFSDHISVSASGRQISYLSLTNMSGRVVISVSDLGKGATITTSQLPAGMYIVTVKADGKTFYKKIIKG